MENTILEEVNRCLNCSNPGCQKGCPYSNNIPDIIKNIKEKNFKQAYEILINTSIIPEISCKICPSYMHCESKCILGIKGKPISIQKIENFLVNYALYNQLDRECMKEMKEKYYRKENEKIKIAVIGAGVSSISFSKYLALRGYTIDIFEKKDILGGIVSNYIPTYRINREVTQNIESELKKIGVNIKYNVEFGKDIKKEQLIREGYKAIFLGIGAQKPRKLNIFGENLENIVTWDDFLYLYNRDSNNIKLKEMKNKKIVIIGGGSTAIDCASVAYKIGIKNIKVIYRRTKDEMKVSKEELKEIENTNIKFEYLSLPIKFIGNKKLEKIECIKMELGEKDLNGRRKPIEIEESNYEIYADYAILALGSDIDNELMQRIGVNVDNLVITNELGMTNMEYIFAGGDVSSNVRDVSKASFLGIEAAKGVEKYLNDAK